MKKCDDRVKRCTDLSEFVESGNKKDSMQKQVSIWILISQVVFCCIIDGKQIDGVWHTGVVVYGREYFFGGGGIEYCEPVYC